MLNVLPSAPTAAPTWSPAPTSASRALGALPQPMLVLHPDRRLVFQNASALALVRQQLALTRAGHLMQLGQLDALRLDEVLRLAAAGSSSHLGLWFNPQLSTGWLHAGPVPFDLAAESGWGAGAVLLLIHLDQPALTQSARIDALTRHCRLSPTERHVLMLLADGLTAEAACGHLGLKLSTVRSHVRNLLGKTQAPSLMQLLRWLGSATALRH